MSKTFITPSIRSVCRLALRLAAGLLPGVAATWLDMSHPLFGLAPVPAAELLVGLLAVATPDLARGRFSPMFGRRCAGLALDLVLPDSVGDLLSVLSQLRTGPRRDRAPSPNPPRLPDSLVKDGWWLVADKNRRPK